MRKIESFREAGYDIVYMDETWVNQNHYTGTRSEGLIDGCDLVFLAKSKDGDYHQEMNSVVFLE
jgi:hypothetical protein